MERFSVSGYDLLERIGTGAYGEVWLGKTTATGSLRAVKIVPASRFGEDRRFQREFEGVRKFEEISRTHPGQLALFHVGYDHEAGLLYYVMELADNACPPAEKAHDAGVDSRYQPHTLRYELRRGRLPVARVVEMGLALAEALEHLHANGLVHRDVKPANIIFVQGRPKLADIGLVSAISDNGSLVGTEGYLPPEGPGTPAADLYALGKVLYESATGQDRTQFPQLPAEVGTWPDAGLLFELNEIILKACGREPRQRHANAQELHRELRLLQQGRSLKRERRWRKVGRALTRVALGLSVLVPAWFLLQHSAPPTAALPPQHWSTNGDANKLFKTGLLAFHQNAADSMAKAAADFRGAIELDPKFARAYARLALAYVWMGPDDPDLLRKAEPLARRAVELDPNSDDAHHAVGTLKTLLAHDWKGAEKEHLESIRLNPSSEDNLYAYANLLAITGRAREAVQEVEKALQLESRSFVLMQNAAFVFASARQYDRAIEMIEAILQKEPSKRADLAMRFLVPAYCGKGDYDRAISLEAEAALLQGQSRAKVEERRAALQRAWFSSGLTGYWRQQLEWAKEGRADPVRLAALSARVGDIEEALAYLERSLRERPNRLAFTINREPGFDVLRGQPRFVRVLKELGLK